MIVVGTVSVAGAGWGGWRHALGVWRKFGCWRSSPPFSRNIHTLLTAEIHKIVYWLCSGVLALDFGNGVVGCVIMWCSWFGGRQSLRLLIYFWPCHLYGLLPGPDHFHVRNSIEFAIWVLYTCIYFKLTVFAGVHVCSFFVNQNAERTRASVLIYDSRGKRGIMWSFCSYIAS